MSTIEEIESYKDIISTVDTKGKRKWIYAFKPKGLFYSRRKILSCFYLLLFFGMPFIKINGYPLFMFNIPDRIFVLFGQVFFPHDFILLGVVMLTALVFIVVFTLIFGRVFCGWVCPQTIFMEMVFRRIEYWIEGPAHKQILNDKKKTTEVYVRKVIKHIIFLVISFFISNTFLAYIIGIDELYKIISEPISEHIGGFLALVGFTLVFYAVFAFVRELVCTVACPYGRLQGVLMDKNTIAVAYDYNRGEPRGKKRKVNAEQPLGDCIDCGMCVNVCPTGIDIRNGLQLECTNCTACIDACNMMMEKVNKPLHLITYASENQLEKKQKFSLNYRAKIFSGVLVVLLVVMSSMLIGREMFDATIMKVPGQLYQEDKKEGTISNLYKIKIVNKSMKTEPYSLRVKEPEASIVFIGNKIDSLETGVHTEETFFIKVNRDELKGRENEFHVEVMSGDKVIQTHKVSFVGKY